MIMMLVSNEKNRMLAKIKKYTSL